MFEEFRALFIKHGQIRTDGFSLQHNQGLKPAIIVIANQKGGCGKTTTAINLSSALANKNFKVLLMDLDGQAHASLGLAVDVDRLSHSIYEVMVKNLELERCIVPTHIDNLDIAPATSMLTGAQLEIADLLGREMILRTCLYKMINTNQKTYDYIIMDCSPSLNLITINGLVAAKSLLIPIQTHYFSLEGMKELFSTVKIVKERLNTPLELLGILPTLFDSRTRMNKEILEQINNYFKGKVFKKPIRMNIKLAEAQAHRQSIFEYDPDSHGAEDHSSLTEEVIAFTHPGLSAVNQSESKNQTETKIN